LQTLNKVALQMRLQTTPTCHNHGDEDTMLNKWREHLCAWLELLHMGPASCTVSKTPPGTRNT
jgi:hypothetical protein